MSAWMHKKPCGLQFCQWKDQAPEKKTKPHQVSGVRAPQQLDMHSSDATQSRPNKRKHDTTFLWQRSLSRELRTRTDTTEPPTSKKARHRDDPRKLAYRTAAEYDEPAVPQKRGGGPQTCFFWYHGHCTRSSRCPHLHRVKEDSGMVEPPPGSQHKRPCGLPRCPGDGARPVKKKGKKKTRQSILRRGKGLDKLSDCAASEAPSCGQDETKEDWYLKGFD